MGELLVLLVLGMAVPTLAADSQQLKKLRQAIQESQKRISQYEKREASLFRAMEANERAEQLIGRELRQSRSEQQDAVKGLERIKAQQVELQQRKAQLAVAMKKRARALYQQGELGAVQVLFSARSLSQLLQRARGLEQLVSHDKRLVAQFREELLRLEHARQQADQERARYRKAVEAADQRARELEKERKAKQHLLAKVKQDRGRESAILQDLEKAAEKLEQALQRLQREARENPSVLPGGSFASLRGRLPPPVDAPITRGFGRVVDQTFRTSTFRKGIDYRAPMGTPVLAVAEGVARFAGWFHAYGKLVIIDHGDEYFTVYAHLNALEVQAGQRVGMGTRLGSVGETGSLAGPLLYFEIRKGARAQNPSKWLQRGSKR